MADVGCWCGTHSWCLLAAQATLVVTAGRSRVIAQMSSAHPSKRCPREDLGRTDGGGDGVGDADLPETGHTRSSEDVEKCERVERGRSVLYCEETEWSEMHRTDHKMSLQVHDRPIAFVEIIGWPILTADRLELKDMLQRWA
ncbi:hypothetical protein BCV70DRAFT_206379 [Testicularia cyperi]|uniref:Uncharacterized protein n=1 Tax=Testicularia cyperi TaxID=1882483 RepID=A0A317XQN1_9BASI|nr:hypothetical protein BCV70DRAFT_206379 [Testicularia cyperi]